MAMLIYGKTDDEGVRTLAYDMATVAVGAGRRDVRLAGAVGSPAVAAAR